MMMAVRRFEDVEFGEEFCYRRDVSAFKESLDLFGMVCLFIYVH